MNVCVCVIWVYGNLFWMCQTHKMIHFNSKLLKYICSEPKMCFVRNKVIDYENVENFFFQLACHQNGFVRHLTKECVDFCSFGFYVSTLEDARLFGWLVWSTVRTSHFNRMSFIYDFSFIFNRFCLFVCVSFFVSMSFHLFYVSLAKNWNLKNKITSVFSFCSSFSYI